MESRINARFKGLPTPALITAMLGGVVVIFIFSLSGGDMQQSVKILCTSLFIGGAAVMVGALLGFLFGIPRSRQSGASGDQGGTPGEEPMYAANTNLEQISDWLIKMLVGVGLIQLTAMPEALQTLSVFLANDGLIKPAMAGTLVVYFSILGFLHGFLWTRLFLAQQMRAADLAALGQKVNLLEQQSDLNAKALSLVKRQLAPHDDAPEVDATELKNAITHASPSTKTTIYYEATTSRQENTRKIYGEPQADAQAIKLYQNKVAKTIPVFRALAESDSKGEFHTNHGQLGFALKDQSTPQWAEAIKELNTAIELRDRSGTTGWLYYEFNRAFCRIAQGNAGDRDMILADLRAAQRNTDLAALIQRLGSVQGWLTQNNAVL